MRDSGHGRGVRANLGVATVSLLCALIAAELGLRAAGRFEPPPYPPVTYRPDLYTSHPGYGYSLWPSRTMYYEYPPAAPRRLEIVSNSAGFRDARELGSEDPRLRLLIVGDSFVFGEGVAAEERFTNRLEALEPNWRIDNLGLPGFGPDLMLMALEAVVERARPDLVLFALYTDDFRRVRERYAGMGFPTPRFRLRDGVLERIPFPRPEPWDRSHLYHGIWTALHGRNARQRPLDDEEWRLNEAILDRARVLAKEHGFRLLLAYLPSRGAGRLHERHRGWVRAYGDRHRIPTLDLSDAIHGADTSRAFLPENAHYAPEGHAIVADELRRFLQQVATP